MTDAERAQIIQHIQAYTRSGRPQLFDEGAWLDHHVLLNWDLYQKAKAERPRLTLERFLFEERQTNPWTKD